MNTTTLEKDCDLLLSSISLRLIYAMKSFINKQMSNASPVEGVFF